MRGGSRFSTPCLLGAGRITVCRRIVVGENGGEDEGTNLQKVLWFVSCKIACEYPTPTERTLAVVCATGYSQ